MDCVNHSGVQASAYCQNCGKAMCPVCVRQGTAGQVFCEPCWMAWQSAQAPIPPPQPGVPNPGVAFALGFIPGVGAMYNGQFAKGFIHLAIFAVLVSLSDHFGLMGLFVAGWIAYQVFDAYHTAKARRDGLPLPDPLGLNEFGSWFQTEMKSEYNRRHPAAYPPAPAAPFAGPVASPAAGPVPPSAAAPQAAPAGTAPPPYAGAYQAPHSNPYQPGYQPPSYPQAYRNPYQPPYWAPGASPWSPGAPPAAGFTPPVPPAPSAGPVYGRRREPVAAIVLIALGVLFLLGQFDLFSGRLFEFSWPVLLIALGGWLLVRRMQESRPAPPFHPATAGAEAAPPAAAPAVEPQPQPEPEPENRPQGGLE